MSHLKRVRLAIQQAGEKIKKEEGTAATPSHDLKAVLEAIEKAYAALGKKP